MRPGLYSGLYPERQEKAAETLEKIWHWIKGSAGRIFDTGESDFKTVISMVSHHGIEMGSASIQSLQAERAEISRDLRKKGLTFASCTRSFALVREMAHRTLTLKPYGTQILAAWTMLHGRLAEMETGEGKTLAASLAAATAAFAGIPVHIITVNDYLVERDAEFLRPLYESLGLTVAFVTQDMTLDARKKAYNCDIVYCSNKQISFDYLRDRLQMGNTRSRLRMDLEPLYAENSHQKNFLLRGLCFAIIDEADSILIDEARTPLILTQQIDNTAEFTIYAQAMELAREMEINQHFVLDPTRRTALLTRSGQNFLSIRYPKGKGIWQSSRMREELVLKALYATHMLVIDKDYLVQDDKVMIIDANTGRTMPDRSWERGLHQMVELKERCPLTPVNEQLGRITYQRFFRRYLRLGGMTGTAKEVRSELWSVYRLGVQRIPLNCPSQRRKLATRVFKDMEDKWDAIVKRTKDCQDQGRPVLIGTSSVAESELLSRVLTRQNIFHQVLNARQNEAEARIVAMAGRHARVTVSTNMAGRGTDIPLGDGIAPRGGLHIISTCRNESGRIDRQLYGRCARQGDPGTFETFLCLEDSLIIENHSPYFIRFFKTMPWANSGLFQPFLRCCFKRAQRRTEQKHYQSRKALLEHDRQTGQLLAFSGNLE